MTGIILVAGYGSRLGNITENTPKCLIDISGKCSLGRMIENLQYSGIQDIIVVTGFKNHMIETYLTEHNLNIKTFYNKDWETTNNAYSLQLALEDINDDILVCNGDVVCYKDLIKELVDSSFFNAMAVVKKQTLNEEDMKVLVYNNLITHVSKQMDCNIKECYGEFTGIFKMHKLLINIFKTELEIITNANPNAWFEHALVRFCTMEFMFLCDVSHYPYIEIDFPEDLEEARDRFPYNDPVWEQGGRHESLKKNQRDLNDALALMVDFRNVLDSFGIRYWLNWGLLLGCVREGHPLQQDTDLDICIDKKDEELLWEKVVPEMKKLRCFVPDRKDHCDNDCFIIRDGERIECNTMEKIQDKYVYSPERCKLACPIKYLDNLQWMDVMGCRFCIPFDAEEMLKGWYGDWQTPSNTKPRSF